MNIDEKPSKLKIGDEIKFGSRKGKVVGYWMGSIDNGLGYYYVVKLDEKSSGYVGSRKDMFISTCLVHIGNED